MTNRYKAAVKAPWAWALDEPAPETAEIPAGRLLTGHLAGVDDEGRVLFVPEGSAAPIAVAIGTTLTDAAVVEAARLRHRALVAATSDDASRPVLVGLVRERVSAAARDAAPGELEVVVNGRALRLEGKTKVELVCGRARIVLHESGRVEVSGTHLLSRSRGAVRIKGATIHLN